ncbi:MAG: hypothetical protein VKP72_14105 [bacterium]|nr:hypothetical protein [bacterium]
MFHLNRRVALLAASALLLVACGQSPTSPVSRPEAAQTTVEAEAAKLGPAQAIQILGMAKFKNGGAGLHFIAVRGGQKVDRTLELQQDGKGKYRALLNGHVVTSQYFQGREGRMMLAELQTLSQVPSGAGASTGRTVQSIPAIAVGATAVYLADLTLRGALAVVALSFYDLGRALQPGTGWSPELKIEALNLLKPFNWGYARWFSPVDPVRS